MAAADTLIGSSIDGSEELIHTNRSPGIGGVRIKNNFKDNEEAAQHQASNSRLGGASSFMVTISPF